MAKKFFPNGDAIGRRWAYGDTIDAESPQIIGVVQDARYSDLRRAFGTDNYEDALDHWFNSGEDENRNASPAARGG